MHPSGFSILGALAGALLAAGPVTAAPTVFTVDTTAQRDSAGDLTSNCTLGDALVAADSDAAVDACGHANLAARKLRGHHRRKSSRSGQKVPCSVRWGATGHYITPNCAVRNFPRINSTIPFVTSAAKQHLTAINTGASLLQF